MLNTQLFERLTTLFGGRLQPTTAPILRLPLAGFQHHSAPRLWPLLDQGLRLRLRREPGNPHDPNAIALYLGDHKLGYIPRERNAPLAGMLDWGMSLTAAIVDLRESEDPWQRVEIEVGLRW